MTASTSSPTRDWRYLCAPWLALGVFSATQTVVSMRAMGMQHAWVTLFLVTVAVWALWIVLTPPVLALQRRYPLPSRRAADWAIHLAACLALGLVWASWNALLEYSFNPFAYPHGAGPFLLLWRAKLLNDFAGNLILYGAIVAVSHSLDARHRLLHQRADSARLSELLAQSQLAALRLQLEPHFIFNALNAVTGLIREQRAQEAITTVAALGDLLRRVTERSDRQLVPLEEEVDFLRKYLDIQQVRFAERLRCQIEIPARLMHAQVPDLILQPLVENAIKHGIARRARGGALRVAAHLEGDSLTLSVANDGPLLALPVREGVGLSNTRQRLQALFGPAQACTLRNDGDHGVLASITLPYRTS